MEKKFCTAKYNRVFKTIFCDEDNTYLMKIFLSRLLNKNIESLVYLRNELEKYRHLVMLDSNKEELERISKRDVFVTKFKDKVEELNEKETWVSAMTREEDYELILNTEKKINYEKGIEDNKKEIALNMLNKGLELSLISEITGLGIDEINKSRTIYN